MKFLNTLNQVQQVTQKPINLTLQTIKKKKKWQNKIMPPFHLLGKSQVKRNTKIIKT